MLREQVQQMRKIKIESDHKDELILQLQLEVHPPGCCKSPTPLARTLVASVCVAPYPRTTSLERTPRGFDAPTTQTTFSPRFIPRYEHKVWERRRFAVLRTKASSAAVSLDVYALGSLIDSRHQPPHEQANKHFLWLRPRSEWDTRGSGWKTLPLEDSAPGRPGQSVQCSGVDGVAQTHQTD